jgi:hypothetical protein
MQNDGLVPGLFCGFGVTLAVCLLIVKFITIPYWKEHSIEYGCAEYNTMTGKFEWKDK